MSPESERHNRADLPERSSRSHLMRDYPKTGSRAPLGARQELNMDAQPVEGKALNQKRRAIV